MPEPSKLYNGVVGSAAFAGTMFLLGVVVWLIGLGVRWVSDLIWGPLPYH